MESAVTQMATMMQGLLKLQKEKKPKAEDFTANHAAPVKLLIQNLLAVNKASGERFSIVLLPDAADPSIVHFDDPGEWMTCIRQQLSQRVFVFPFIGHYTPISTGPLRYIQTPHGMLPLFEAPNAESVQFEPSGWVGPERTEIQIPTTPQREETLPAVEAELVDDDEEAGVFPER